MAATRIWLGFLAALVLAGRASALDPEKPFSQYVVDSWSVQEGFPQVSALQIVQDHTGYIWASTQSGLARFDGVRFRTFNVRTTPQLLTDHLEVLYIDREGALWIGSNRGLTVKRGASFSVVIEGDDRVGPVLAIGEGPGGQLWVGAEGGLFRDAGKVEVLGQPVYALHWEGATLWAGGAGVLYRIAGERVERLALPDPEARVEHLAGDGERLWLGTTRGLYVLDADEVIAARLPSGLGDDMKVEALYRDRHGSLWIGSYEYLIRRLPDGRHESIDREDLGFRPWIVSITEDREGNLWLGSKTHSLIRLWEGWTRRYSTAEGLDDPFVWSVAVDPGGTIWIGTNSGLSRLDEGRIATEVTGDRLVNPAVYSLLVEGMGCLWLGTRGGLDYYCEGQLQTLEAMSALNGRQINALLRRADGALWIGTSDGLFRYDGERIAVIEGFERNSGRIRILHEISPDHLLIGTEAGLYSLEQGGIESMASGIGLGEAFITAIGRLPDGRTAIGTLGRGLYLGEPGGDWLQLRPEHGLPTGALFYLDVSPEGFLWVGGEVGAFRVEFDSLPKSTREQSPGPLAVQNLASSNQLSGSQPARCCNGAGTAKGLRFAESYWFPTLDGVLEIQPESIKRTAPPPPVVVESVMVNGELRRAMEESLRLSPEERDFSVNFTALTFQDPRNVLFRYRLVGYSDEWVWAGRRRTAYFTNLRPGRYEFEVAAASNPGRWSADAARLRLELAPTVVESLWFRLLLGLALLALLVAIYALRTREARRIRQRLQRLVAERTRALDEANRLLRLANRKLEQASESDPLTGLGNRRFVQKRLQPGTPAHRQLFDRDRMPMLMVLADIDRFKQINDLHGHAAGDDVLRQFAELLQRQIREGDAAVRWGGEEFLLLLGKGADERATAVAERLRRAVEQHRFELEGTTLIRMTCSFGVAPLTGPEIDSEFAAHWSVVLELADRALYAVKEGGRNGWAVVERAELGEMRAGQEATAIAEQVVSEGGIQLRASRVEIADTFFAAAQDRERSSFI